MAKDIKKEEKEKKKKEEIEMVQKQKKAAELPKSTNPKDYN